MGKKPYIRVKKGWVRIYEDGPGNEGRYVEFLLEYIPSFIDDLYRLTVPSQADLDRLNRRIDLVEKRLERSMERRS